MTGDEGSGGGAGVPPPDPTQQQGDPPPRQGEAPPQPESASPPPPPPARPPLRRSRTDRVLFGVAGGLGSHLGIDPVLVRVAFVLLGLFGGSGVLLYVVGLIAIPEEAPTAEVGGTGAVPRERAAAPAAGNAVAIIGVALVLAGSFALLRQVVPGLGRVAGPLLLIVTGGFVLLASRR